MDGEHLGDLGCLGEDVQEPEGGQAQGSVPGGQEDAVCVLNRMFSFGSARNRKGKQKPN